MPATNVGMVGFFSKISATTTAIGSSSTGAEPELGGDGSEDILIHLTAHRTAGKPQTVEEEEH